MTNYDEDYRRAARNTKILVAIALIIAVVVAYFLGRIARG